VEQELGINLEPTYMGTSHAIIIDLHTINLNSPLLTMKKKIQLFLKVDYDKVFIKPFSL